MCVRARDAQMRVFRVFLLKEKRKFQNITTTASFGPSRAREHKNSKFVFLCILDMFSFLFFLSFLIVIKKNNLKTVLFFDTLFCVMDTQCKVK